MRDRQRHDVRAGLVGGRQRVAHHLEAVADAREHADPLGALAGVHERDPRRLQSRAERGVLRQLASADGGELLDELGLRRGDDAETYVLPRAHRPAADGARDRGIRVCPESVRGASREVEEAGLVVARHQEQLDLRLLLGRVAGVLDDDVHVGAAEAERAAASDAMVGVPRLGLDRDMEARAVETQLRLGAVEARHRRDRPVVHCQGRADEARDASRRHRVADVGLRGADGHAALTVVAQRLNQPLELALVTDRRARAVGLDVAEHLRVDSGVRPGLADHVHLPLEHRRHRARPAAIVVDAQAADDPVDPVAVTARIGEPLEHDDSAPFALDEPVGAGVEGATDATPRDRAYPGEADVVLRGHRQIDAASQRCVDRTRTECGDGVCKCHERRSARSVEGVRGPLQAQLLRHGRRDHVREAARRGEGP